MLRAYGTDSDSRRKRLVDALGEARFVAIREQHDNSPRMAKPADVYLATKRLTELFAGVRGVLIVDDGRACLKGEDVRMLLVACGGHRYLDPVPIEANLDWEQRTAIRREAGLERASWERPIADGTLRGLGELLKLIGTLEPEAKQARAMLLWDALADLESRQGSGAFLGTYTWGYSHASQTVKLDTAFVCLLNEASWIAGSEGSLHRPSEVLFESLGWKPNPFLLSKIRFKPPIIDQLAKEAGFEPGVLDLLKKRGITSEAQLLQLLGVEGEPSDNDDEPGDVDDAPKKLLGDVPGPTPPVPDSTITNLIPAGSGGTGTARAGAEIGGQGEGWGKGQGQGGGKRTPGSVGGWPFISYVATHADDEGPDPDGLEQAARMALEAKAIELIRAREPIWKPTATHNYLRPWLAWSGRA